MSVAAIYFDGESSRKHAVTLNMAATLEITEDGKDLAAWPYGEIRRADGPKNVMRLKSSSAAPLARLEIRDPAAQVEIGKLCGGLAREAGDDVSTLRIVFWSLGAVVSILAVIWFGLPVFAERVTPFVPASLENRIGDVADRQMHALFGTKTCTAPEGVQALDKLVGTLTRTAGLDMTRAPAVLDTAIPNAVALPGGKVYVLKGLLDKAQSPDEVAGVLAHELGHVAHRDGVRRLIQDGSSSFLVGLLFGDVTGASVALTAGRGMLTSAYSRDAEAKADLFAGDLMGKLGRSPKPLGDLLMRITGPQTDNPLAIFASHPLSADRLAMLEKNQVTVTGQELLTPAEWRALKAICQKP